MKRRAPSKRKNAYAIVMTLALVALLAILIVGLLAVSRTESTTAAAARDHAVARANARYALDLALAELQRLAGPDQRVTARADLIGEDAANGRLTAVWDAADPEAEPAFLVSGNENVSPFGFGDGDTYPATYTKHDTALPDPSEGGGLESAWLVRRAVEDEADRVKARRVPIGGADANAGGYAWWVGDEGVKARANLGDPWRDAEDEGDRAHAIRVAQREATERADELLADADPADARLPRAATLGQVMLAAEADDPGAAARRLFHDLTPWSRGLITNTRDGGLRRDLTLAFEDSAIFTRLFGAVSNTNADLFIVREIGEDTGTPAGPNWAGMRDFFNQADRLNDDGTLTPFHPEPRVAVKMRAYDWNPYRHGIQDGGQKVDTYQTNSPVNPIMARCQIDIRLRTEKLPQTDPNAVARYQVQLEFKPVIGLWNPYNVKMRGVEFTFDWEMGPVIDIEAGGVRRTVDMRELWSGSNDEWFRMRTDRGIDFLPGEFRLFTVATRSTLAQSVKLVPAYVEEGAFYARLREGTADNAPIIEVNEGEDIKIYSVDMSNGERGSAPDRTVGTFLALKITPNAAVEDSTMRTVDLWQPTEGNDPKKVEDFPPYRPSELDHKAGKPAAILAAWAYYQRTTREEVQGLRNLADANIRFMVGNSRWDGSKDGAGWNAISPFSGGTDNGLLPVGDEAPHSPGGARYPGYGGSSIGAGGQERVIAFDVPRQPPISLGAFQHANLGRYNNEPTYLIGNSYANPRIPLGETQTRNFMGSGGPDVYDLSYRTNEELWDRYFLSTLDPAMSQGDLDALRDPLFGKPLPNARLRLYDPEQKLELGDLTDPDEAGYEALAARFTIEGAFNINSTSVAAWKAVLAGLSGVSVPLHKPDDATFDEWKTTEAAAVFSRFSAPLAEAFGGSGGDEAFWLGYRELTADQLQNLAEAVVDEVRARGPFRSVADFVNRRLVGPDEQRLSGALQAALDSEKAGVNFDLDSQLGDKAVAVDNSQGWFDSAALSGVEKGSQATGMPGYVLQGDILQALGPSISARSDTFKIRAYGDAQARNGRLTARAWCEAVVQRLPDPVEGDRDNPADLAHPPGDLGRRFVIVSFRWLAPEDV